MPFNIKIEINYREVVKIFGRNVGPTECGRTRYGYSAKVGEKEITSEVIHDRSKGIERLAGLILIDLSNLKASPLDAAEFLAARIRERS